MKFLKRVIVLSCLLAFCPAALASACPAPDSHNKIALFLADWNRCAPLARAGQIIELQDDQFVNNPNHQLKLPYVAPIDGEKPLIITARPGLKFRKRISFYIGRPNVTLQNMTFIDSAKEIELPLKLPIVQIHGQKANQPISNVKLSGLSFINVNSSSSVISIGSNGGAPVTGVRITGSIFDQVNNSIVIKSELGASRIWIDHNIFKDSNCSLGNGCDMIHIGSQLYGPRETWTPVRSHVTIENNQFIRIKGESELISSKTWNTTIRHNLIVEPKGSISFRSGGDSVAAGNVFINPEKSAFVISGTNQMIRYNLIFKPSGSPVLLNMGNPVPATGTWYGATRECKARPVDKPMVVYPPADDAMILDNIAFVDGVDKSQFVNNKTITNCGCLISNPKMSLECSSKGRDLFQMSNSFNPRPDWIEDKNKCIVFTKPKAKGQSFYEITDCPAQRKSNTVPLKYE